MGMMLLTPENGDYFRERIQRLTPESERQFGQLDAVGMMKHMRNATETALGEVEMPGKPNALVGKILYLTITHVITKWPGGKIKAPDYWTPPADKEFDDEKEALLAALDRFFAKVAEGGSTKTEHPMLGPLTIQQWARLNGIHFQHHFRQFSVL